jgi:hypothetical protein
MKLIEGSKETLDMLHECYEPEVIADLKFPDNGSVFKNGHSEPSRMSLPRNAINC